MLFFFFFSSRRRHTRCYRDWSSDVCSSDLPNFDDFRDQSRSFQAIAKYNEVIASVSGASQPTRTTVAHVSPDFLKVFGIQPILGQDFRASDAKKGAGPTVLVSYGYWKQHLGSPQDLSQSHLKIDSGVFSVIGVLPAGFRFPAE